MNRNEAIELNPCPCGCVPNELFIEDGQTHRWRNVSALCNNPKCPNWTIEVRVSYEWTPTEIRDHCIAEWNKATKPKALAMPKDAGQGAFRTATVKFIGIDPLNICKGATEPMVMDSWRFGFIEESDGTLRFAFNDKGPLVAVNAVAPKADAERVASPVFHLNELLETPLDNNPPKADAERVALLERIDYWLTGKDFEYESDTQLMSDIRAYLQGGA